MLGFGPLLKGSISFVFLIFASWCVGEGGEILGKKYDASIIGGLVIAWLNTAPETIFFITALNSGNSAFAVGAVTGSTVVVCTVALGSCLWIGAKAKANGIIVLQPAVKEQCRMLGLSTTVTFAVAVIGYSYLCGIAGVLFYLWFMWKSLQKDENADRLHDTELGVDDEDEEDQPVSKGFIYLCLGGALIILFSSPFISAVEEAAFIHKVNPILLAFFLAPIASEAPEILESISLSRKGNSQSINIAYSNLVGGTITKTTLLLGIFCFFGVGGDLEWQHPTFTINLLMLMLCALAAAGIGYHLPKQNQWHGVSLFALFVMVSLLQYSLVGSVEELPVPNLVNSPEPSLE